jgi:hypothetical protein
VQRRRTAAPVAVAERDDALDEIARAFGIGNGRQRSWPAAPELANGALRIDPKSIC